MEPVITTLPSRLLVGLEAPFVSGLSADTTTTTVIPDLWRRFDARQGEISGRLGTQTYGLISALEGADAREDAMRYLAAAEVEPGTASPGADWVLRELPEGLYAVFTHKGPVSAFGETLRQVYTVWLPNAGYTRRRGPEFERYDARFQDENPASEFEYAIPVAPKP